MTQYISKKITFFYIKYFDTESPYLSKKQQLATGLESHASKHLRMNNYNYLKKKFQNFGNGYLLLINTVQIEWQETCVQLQTHYFPDFGDQALWCCPHKLIQLRSPKRGQEHTYYYQLCSINNFRSSCAVFLR